MSIYTLYKFLLGSLFTVLSLQLLSGAAGAADAARNLAQRVHDRADGADVSTRSIMTLMAKGQESRQREIYTFALETGDNKRLSLARFVSPPDVEGTGLLTIDYPGDKSDQWLYLPALDRVRRISTSRKGGRFVGSDLFYEDLRDREVSMDKHQLKGRGKVGGIQCEILMSTPTDPVNSVYKARVSWIDPKTLIPLRIDYYAGRHKRPVKRFTVKRVKKVQRYWTVTDSQMQDLVEGTRTRLQVQAIRYDQDLPETLFTSKNLADMSREAAYRP